MPANWLISAQGDAINLDYIAKVMWGGDFKAATADQQKRLYIFHGGVASGAGVSNATTVYEYANATLAIAAKNRVLNLLKTLGVAYDFTQPTASLTAVTPANSAAGATTLTTLTGSGFINGGTITINNVPMPVTVVAGVAKFTTDATLTAGTYDVIYTDNAGAAATLANGITLT